ncbi:helix-turn-helix domain-containing protein [Sulfitobacter mediterraneus]|jgi:transcriptional regulator with XRE-family HTH domain|uniref:helix-turn-helix domain-containing protein n=1 Tax=Sulfitobacter mediterraneus TaxID=83219 RepID=UPI0021A3C0AF|nr:helix-turn-helix transcriptional regulator [Sulfitobacter mediterraneus]UWR10964.1 helix-turn-helix domain-containing protein [Sulfitobacter mediterraneus]
MGLKTVEQLREARAALGWTQAQVAMAAGVSVPTIKRLEGASGGLAIRLETLSRLESAFVAEGITFLEDGQAAVGFGVSLGVLKPK